MSDERFAGLPPEAEASSSVTKRDYIEYTLPKAKLGMRWDLEDEYLTFRLSELTPNMQHAAAKIAKDNTSVLQQELMFKSITRIGDKGVGQNRDFLDHWWMAIGPKCRMLITSAFGEMVSVEESDTEAFLASGKPGTA